MIEAGAAGVHFEDQLASEKKCGHLGGKVLVPTGQFIRTLVAARLAADVLDVPTRADRAHRRRQREAAHVAMSTRATSRSSHGRAHARGLLPAARAGSSAAIARGLAYAPYADLLWCETSTPDLGEAREFAEARPREVPGQAARLQLLAVVQLDEAPRRRDDRQVPARAGRDGLQVPVRHARRLPRAELQHVRARARLPRPRAWRPTRELQQTRFARERDGYTATRHQREVGTGYFDLVAEAVSAGQASTLALAESTEAQQF